MSWSRSFPAVQVSASAAAGPVKHAIKIVTYNVLASKYATSGMHNYCEPSYLQWPYRRERILEELDVYDSDILCLQEVEHGVFHSELGPQLLKRGFKGWYMARQSGEVVGEPEGVALFYRESMFRPISQKSVRFSDCQTPVSSNSATGSDRAGKAGFWEVFMRREEGAIMALLEHTVSGRPLLAACTHLFWNPHFPDVKALQAATLCQEIQHFLRENPQSPEAETATTNIPVLVGGDFNSLWKKFKSDIFDKVPSGSSVRSGVYTLMSEGVLRPEHPDHPFTRRGSSKWQSGAGSSYSSVSSYDEDAQESSGSVSEDFRGVVLTNSGLRLSSMHMLAHGWEPPLTTKTGSFAGCLDYIWVSNGHGIKIEHTLSLPYKHLQERSKGQDRGGGSSKQLPLKVEDPFAQVDFPAIPNKEYPSDHIAMGCQLIW